MKTEKLIARAWVLAHGKDCDGYNRGSLSAYSTLSEANKSAEESAYWSDGLMYYVTEKWTEVVEYIQDYSRTQEQIDDKLEYYQYAYQDVNSLTDEA